MLRQKGKVKKINFECRYDLPNDYFVLKHDRGLYEIRTANRSEQLDNQIKTNYSSLIQHL